MLTIRDEYDWSNRRQVIVSAKETLEQRLLRLIGVGDST